MPVAPPAERLQWAVGRRAETDYVFAFWTALGWSILTCGIYGFYVTYQLFRRSVEHNKRRLAVLEATNALAWERAVAMGRADELTPNFQAVGWHLGELGRVSQEFRDPALWTVICALTSGIGQIVGYIFLDQDLTAHETAERAAEEQLAGILATLGVGVALPAAPIPKGRHNYGGRVLALFGTCGLYGLWWLYDLMVEPNENFRHDWGREDAFVAALHGGV